MLRALIVLLLLANLGFWAWHHEGVAQALGLPRHSDREPERLARQINPQALRLVAAAPASAAAGPGVAPCMETPALTADAAAALARALRQAGLAAERWTELRRETGGRWAVVWGRDEPAARLQRRLAQLPELKLAGAEPLIADNNLQLGRFPSAEAAERQLAAWREQGLRGAQVLTLDPPRTEVRLRAESLDATGWTALKAATPASGPSWAACATSTP